MSILRKTITSHLARQTLEPRIGVSLPWVKRWSRRCPGETERLASDPSPVDASVDSFINTSGAGAVYARMLGIRRHTLKTDVINLLEDCGLTVDDVKFNYSRGYAPVGTMLRFPSHAAYATATKNLTKKARLYRIEMADRSQWDLLAPYDGKAVLLQGIPRNALQEDVERFLTGCDYDQTSIQMFLRPGIPDPIRMALVRFPSQTQAMHAFLTKNRGFCLNNQITVRVLQ